MLAYERNRRGGSRIVEAKRRRLVSRSLETEEDMLHDLDVWGRYPVVALPMALCAAVILAGQVVT